MENTVGRYQYSGNNSTDANPFIDRSEQRHPNRQRTDPSTDNCPSAIRHSLTGDYHRPALAESITGRSTRIERPSVGRQALQEVATLVTPDTIQRWHRQLIARKWTATCWRRFRGAPARHHCLHLRQRNSP